MCIPRAKIEPRPSRVLYAAHALAVDSKRKKDLQRPSNDAVGSPRRRLTVVHNGEVAAPKHGTSRVARHRPRTARRTSENGRHSLMDSAPTTPGRCGVAKRSCAIGCPRGKKREHALPRAARRARTRRRLKTGTRHEKTYKRRRQAVAASFASRAQWGSPRAKTRYRPSGAPQAAHSVPDI